MNSIPLNCVSPLLLTHMKVVANPESKNALYAAFECATRIWPQYYDDLMKFGDEPLHEVEHDIKFHCMAVLAGAKYKLPKKAMMDAGMNLVERLWIDTGLSVDDFCVLIEPPGTSELTNALRAFLQTLELAAVDKRQVH